jgi:hypothetical protein
MRLRENKKLSLSTPKRRDISFSRLNDWMMRTPSRLSLIVP